MTDQTRIRVLVNIHTNTSPDADPQTETKKHECFERWLQAAKDAGNSAPDSLKRLLAGADVEQVSPDEAEEIKAWASTIDGWQDAPEGEKPLLFQPVGHAVWF